MPWDLQGNGGIGAGDWLGTRNAMALMIRTNDNAQAIGAQPPLDPQEAMRITPFEPGGATRRGRVGIWTNAPARALHVEDQIHTGGDEAGLSFGNRLDPATGGPSPFTDVPFNGERWVWRASEGTAHLWSNDNKISVTAAGNFGIGVAPVSLLTQKLMLGSGNVLLPNANAGIDGNLYFGGRTDTGQTGLRLFGGLVNGSIPAGFIDVRSTDPNDGLRIRVDTGNGGTERLRVTSNEVIHRVPLSHQSCDIRTKTNIQRLDGALDKLEHVRGVAFVWDESSRGGPPGQPSIGVIAQEVEEVFPELVSDSGDEEGYKGVDHFGLTAALIEAAKELKADNEALRSRIEALERA
jgi:hypothetical protein